MQDGNKVKIFIPKLTILGITLRQSSEKMIDEEVRLSTEKGDIISDDLMAQRTFKCRTELFKAIKEGLRAVELHVSGFSPIRLHQNDVKFVMDQQLNGPIAEFLVTGYCTRKGNHDDWAREGKVTLFFKDQQQMKDYLEIVWPPEQQNITAYDTSKSSGLWGL